MKINREMVSRVENCRYWSGVWVYWEALHLSHFISVVLCLGYMPQIHFIFEANAYQGDIFEPTLHLVCGLRSRE